MTTSINWPATVNQNYILGTLSIQPDDNVARFQPEVGPPISRRRTSIGVDTVSFDQRCTGTEWAALRTWYRNTVKESLSFNRTNPETCAAQEFVFASPPEAHELARHSYQVTIRLKKVP